MMKSHVCVLAVAGTISLAALASVSPSAAQDYFGADDRAFCQDADYYSRNEAFCSRVLQEDGTGFNTSYPDPYAATAQDDGRVRNSNYNGNRDYLPGQPSLSARTDSSYGRDDSNLPYGDAAPDQEFGKSNWFGYSNDSNSYTGQRTTTPTW